MKRNEFIKNATAVTLLGSLTPGVMNAANFALQKPDAQTEYGVQLFSLPLALENNVEKTIEMLAKLGYKKVELYGPYPFSAESAHQRWNAVTPMLGFSGSGFFGKTAIEMKNLFDHNGIEVPSMHTDLDTLEHHMDELARAAEIMGYTYVILPSIPDERRVTLDDYKRMADTFNTIGMNAKNSGLKFAYHNHGYGLSEMDGQIPLHLILNQTDPEVVFFEMDLFWTVSGKADPVEYLSRYKDRYHLMHVKDMKELKTFSGDGGDASQWIELFPNMTNAGDGVLPLDTILEAAKQNGVKHFIVEQDMVENPEVALGKSITNLKGM